jgi:S1-C subfamily serine protease
MGPLGRDRSYNRPESRQATAELGLTFESPRRIIPSRPMRRSPAAEALRHVLAASIGCVWLFVAAATDAGSPEAMAVRTSQRIGEVLADRRVDVSAKWPGGASRGLRETFKDTVGAVPLVISTDGVGSSVVVHVDTEKRAGLLVTNEHVVVAPFLSDDKKTRFVVLLFYEASLATNVFDRARVVRCLSTPDASPWCSVLRSVTRVGVVVANDPGRDLALVRVEDMPQSVRSIALGRVDSISPGDEVVVIGHPVGLLWSLTTGIISGVRSNFRISALATESTVLQTQTPVNPGNSGGPLLTPDCRLIGVIFGSRTVSASQSAHGDVKVVAPGLNFAVAVNEVQGFLSRNSAR